MIFWCPIDDEEDFLNRYSPEMEDDDYYHYHDHDYYMTKAMVFILDDHGHKLINDTNSSIGFITDKDAIILNKKDYLNSRGGFSWQIVLFDGKTKPMVGVPSYVIDAANSKYSDFFDD